MAEKKYEEREKDNKAWISGRIEKEFEFSHEAYGEKFYKTRVIVPRLSQVEDCIPIVISSRLLNDIETSSFEGRNVNLFGQFRSYNKYQEDGRYTLDLFLFVTEIDFCDDENEMVENQNKNFVYLEGNICKPPIYRTTPFGRQITDMIIAVNRRYYKSDYIPCIAWGRNAQFTEHLDVGTRIRIEGRIQSRQYEKVVSEQTEERITRDAYEISITRITVI